MTPITCSHCQHPVWATDLRICEACQCRVCVECACELNSTAASCPICQSGRVEAPLSSFNALESEPQWYEAQPGQERLAMELAEMQRRGFVGVTTSVLPDRRLTLRFPFEDGTGVKFFTVITQSNHPTSYPQIVLECDGFVMSPGQDSSDMARDLYESVERSQALDRYQRAVCGQPAPLAEYFAMYRYGRPIHLPRENKFAPWYGTPSGKKRLADEITALNNARLLFESRLLANGNMVLVIDGGLLKRPDAVIAVFPSEYPRVSVSITVGRESVQSSTLIIPTLPPFLETAPLLIEVIALKLGETW